jgi:hypothetical protein
MIPEAPVTAEQNHLAAVRMIRAVRDWDCPVHLPYLFYEIGIDLETLGFDECASILSKIVAELERDDYPEALKQRILFAAPFAKTEQQAADDNEPSITITIAERLIAEKNEHIKRLERKLRNR